MKDEHVTCDRCGRDATEKYGGSINLVRRGKNYDLCNNCSFECQYWIEKGNNPAHVMTVDQAHE